MWAVLAGAGVALLTTGGVHHLDLVGVGMALLAGACWAGYIVLSKETGRRFPGPSGLAVAMVVAAVVGPAGRPGHRREVHAAARVPSGIGAAVALLSSVVPYSLELVALRRVTPRAFGVLLSLDPAVAALVGLVALGQHLTWRELVALVLVVAANAGSVLAGEGEAVAATGGRARLTPGGRSSASSGSVRTLGGRWTPRVDQRPSLHRSGRLWPRGPGRLARIDFSPVRRPPRMAAVVVWPRWWRSPARWRPTRTWWPLGTRGLPLDPRLRALRLRGLRQAHSHRRVVACAAWPVVTPVTSAPRWLFLRLAVAVTLVLFLPDVWILLHSGTAEAVAVLMAMHVAIAVVTYNALVRLAPLRRRRRPPSV